MSVFKFGKKRNVHGYEEIDVNGKWMAIYDDTQIDDADYDTKFPEFAHMDIEKFTEFINTAFLNYRSSKATKKITKRVIDNSNHWYKSFSGEKKTELCLRMKTKFTAMIENYIANHPANKLNDYYLDLDRRVQANSYPKFPVLGEKDIGKLPQYDINNDSLVGTVPMFVKLASVVYPSFKRTRNTYEMM